MRHRKEVLRFSWWQICVLALCLHVCVGQNNCPPTYSPYGCRTCFRVLNETSLAKNFTDAGEICQTQADSGTHDLSVFNSSEQRSLIRTYLKLNDIKNRLWVGMKYRDDGILVDINGIPVNVSTLGIKFDEEVAATAGLCVSVMLSSDRSRVLFYRQQCSEVQGFICTISSIELTVNSITSTPDGYGIAGQSVALRCNFQPTRPPIDITWSFTNANGDTSVVMPTEQDTLEPETGYGELLIQNFQVEHSGNYSCSISVLDGDNVLGGITSAEKSIKLAVAPTLLHSPEDRTFFIGAVSFLECGIRNDTFPPPTVRWYKSEDEVLTDSEEIISNSDRSKYFISPNTKTLLIADSTSTDGGMYRCVATNAAGSVTSRGGQLTFKTASIVPEMTGMIVLEPADITAELGSNVTFDSVGVIDCNDCDNYQWFTLNADGFVIDITHQFMRGRINSATYTNIQFFDPDDTSTFVSTRVQLNPGGNSIVGQRDVSLTVVERANITSISSNTMFAFGDEAQFWCSFRGTPPPDVQWYFNGRPVSNSDEFTIQTTPSNKAIPGSTSLTIRNFQVKDTGSYQCVLTNYLASSARDFRLCGMDGTPGPVTEMSILPISQTQVRVRWSPPTFANSDPNLLQYRLYWADIPVGVTLDISTATEMTELLPFTDNGYLINDLNTVYRVSVIIVAYSYIGRGEESSPLSNRTYGSVPAELPDPVNATRTNDNKTFEVTWDEVVPKREEGEGEVYRYDVSFFKCGDEDSRTILEGSHPPVTSMEIPDVDPDTNYTIQVRVTVLIQSEPEVEFAHGVWSGEPCQQPIMDDDDDSDSDSTVIIIGVVVVVVLILIIAISGGVFFYVYQRGQRGRYFPAKSEEKKGTLRLKEQQQKAAIFSNGQSTGLTDDSASHPKTNGNFDA